MNISKNGPPKVLSKLYIYFCKEYVWLIHKSNNVCPKHSLETCNSAFCSLYTHTIHVQVSGHVLQKLIISWHMVDQSKLVIFVSESLSRPVHCNYVYKCSYSLATCTTYRNFKKLQKGVSIATKSKGNK